MSISVEKISKNFGSFVALSDVSLKVNTGELIALLGPSGSGKTTLLRIIAGLETPNSGSGPIRFHDEDVRKTNIGDRRVGFVFQHYALFRNMTVADNIAFGMKVRPRKTRPSKKAIRDRVHELLQLVQLDFLAHRYPNQLSGGQRQRVALARALAMEPKVLLLDEPFGALDAKVRRELRSWLKRLQREVNITTVFVTHDQDEALELADRVVVMNQGKIEQVGTPDQVFHDPKTKFVVNFLGQVNHFTGSIKEGKVRFSTVAWEPPELDRSLNGSASIFVRPHEFQIEKNKPQGACFRATVVDIHSAGPNVQLSLEAETGERLIVELSQDRYHAIQVTMGSQVWVSPKNATYFVDE
jgi:sulfate/thiosulfate transport system ATP-binding protein